MGVHRGQEEGKQCRDSQLGAYHLLKSELKLFVSICSSCNCCCTYYTDSNSARKRTTSMQLQ